VQPVKELAALAHKVGAVFFTDAVQAAPYMPIDVKALGVDMLSLSSHKFYGPKGCGALYIKSGVKIKGHIVGGEQERGLRGGTTNVAAVVGLAAAYQKTVETLSQTQEKLTALRKAFLDELSILDGVTVNGGKEGDLPAVLNLRIDGVNNADFVYSMDLQGVCVAAGSACASASIKPSHVLTAMGFTDEEAKEAERAAKEAAIMAELESLRHEKLVGSYVNAYMAMGYDEKLAKATAEAMAKGDTETVFKNQKVHLENREKALRTELLMQTPPPAPGVPDAGMKKADFMKLSLAEKQRFATENPEQYKAFYAE
jgi:hypothetical protein